MKPLVTFLLSISTVLAQYQQDYFQISGYQGAYEDVIPAANGCIISGNILDNGLHGYVAAIDSTGTLLWDDTINPNTFAFALGIKTDHNANIFAAGQYEATNGVNDIVCRKYDASGNRLWTRTWDTPGNFNPDDFGDMMVNPAGDVLIVGSGRLSPPSTNPLLLRYSSSGALLKDSILSQSGSSKFMAVRPHASGMFALSKLNYGTIRNITIHRFNSLYQLSWKTSLPMQAYGSKTLLAINSQGYSATGGQKLTIGEAVFAVCRPNGDTAFTRTVKTNDLPYGEVINLAMDDSKYIYVLSRHGYTNLLSKYDTSGTHYWHDTLPRNSGSRYFENQDIFTYFNGRLFYTSAYINSRLLVYDTAGNRLQSTAINISPLSQGGISRVLVDSSGVYISGNANSGGSNRNGFMVHFKDTSSIQQPSSVLPEQNNFRSVEVFPCPATNEIEFRMSSQPSYIQIWDMNGRMVMDKQHHERRLNIHEFADGHYQLKLIDVEGNVFKGEILKK